MKNASKNKTRVNANNLASQVIAKYPKWSDYKHQAANLKCWDGITNLMYKTSPDEYKWEALTDVLNSMVSTLRGTPFTKGYHVQVSKRGVVTGNGTLVSYYGDEFTFTGVEFLAVVKLALASYLQIDLSDELIALGHEFKYSKEELVRVMD